jgi:hypothetical protein
MNAPPPIPELCGSTSESIAWMAIAASTALPPRFRTLSPAWVASGLAAIEKGSAVVTRAGAVRIVTGAAGAVAPAVKAAIASADVSLRSDSMEAD